MLYYFLTCLGGSIILLSLPFCESHALHVLPLAFVSFGSQVM